MRKLVAICALSFATLSAIILIGERRITTHAEGRIFGALEEIPERRVALVLGTAAETRGGGPNRYFSNRMQAAARLHHAGKVDHLLLSGDNGTWGYNEPMDMRKALVALGVDSTDMTLDFAGFDTYASVVRAKKVFGVDRLTVVSQHFHNERALYIAEHQGIDAIAWDAGDEGIRRTRWSWVRERGARLKMWKDILFEVDPHFLGEPVELGTQVLPLDMPR